MDAIRVAWVGALLCVIGACSSSSSGGSSSGGVDAGGDGAPSDAGGDAKPGDDGGGGADGGPCGAGANLGSDVDVQQMAADPPTPMGGTIADGTYVLTSGTLYTGADGGATGPLGLTLKQTWRISGSAYSHVDFNQMMGRETRQGGTLMTVSAISLHLVQACPDADFASYEFSATPTTFTLYSLDASGTLALVLTRQ